MVFGIEIEYITTTGSHDCDKAVRSRGCGELPGSDGHGLLKSWEHLDEVEKLQIQEKMDWNLSPLSSPLECLCRLKLTINKNEGGKKESVQNLVKFFQFCEVILRWPKTEDRIRPCKAKCCISQPKNKLYNYLKTLIFSFICKFLTVNPNYKGRGYKSLTLVRGSRSL